MLLNRGMLDVRSRIKASVVLSTIVVLCGLHSASGQVFRETQRLHAEGVREGYAFGGAVDVSGDTAIVGAIGTPVFGDKSGAVYVFQQDSKGNWHQVARLTAPDGERKDQFGEALAISGDHIVVGAPRKNTNGLNSGAAYIFNRKQGDPNKWIPKKKLIAVDPRENDLFGLSVAIDGNTVVIGSQGDNARGKASGSVYVFERNHGGVDNWGAFRKLKASDGTQYDLFGKSVAINGDVIIVGASSDSDLWGRGGSAYVFERNQGGENNWGQVTKLLPDVPHAEQEFGYSVAVSGQIASIGARKDSLNSTKGGAIYVFKRQNDAENQWVQEFKLLPSEPSKENQFSYSVGMSGEKILGTMPLSDQIRPNTGCAFVFQHRPEAENPNNWDQVEVLTGSDSRGSDFFGLAGAIDGDTVIIGARGNDEHGNEAGAAYIFEQVGQRKQEELKTQDEL